MIIILKIKEFLFILVIVIIFQNVKLVLIIKQNAKNVLKIIILSEIPKKNVNIFQIMIWINIFQKIIISHIIYVIPQWKNVTNV